MAAYEESTPTTRMRPNPKHFLTWSAANNRIQKLSKNFVNNVSKLQSKVEKVMHFHPPPHCSDQVENDLSEPNKDQNHEACHISRVKIPLRSSLSNCEKNECKTGSCASEVFSTTCSVVSEQRYSGFSPSSYRAQGKEFPSGDSSSATSSVAGGNAMKVAVSQLGTEHGSSCVTTATATTGPGFPHQIQVQSARIVQSHPIVPFKQDSASTPKRLLQSGHYKIPSNPTITAEALKAMIINSPTELNSCRKFEEKPQPIKNRSGPLTAIVANVHNSQIPSSISQNALTNGKDSDKRINNGSHHQSSLNGNMSSTNVDEISSHGVDNEGLTIIDPKPSVSFSSPVIESSDKASLLINGKKSYSKKGKSNKNIQGNMKSGNDKRSVAFQNPLSSFSSASNRKHASVSPEASPSQLTVTIFEEEAELRHAPWFQAGIPRDIALEVLRNQPIGSFIVRESTTKAGCFALSLRVPKDFKRLGIAHYLILKSGRGYKIKGFTKEFKSLSSLITHHSVMPELLPCPLSLHRYHPNHPQKISRINSSDFMEPEKLIGFTNFVDCLESS
ncbi:Tensin-4 [Orchesella cincta]|uniref:Tensin-4 n=1 Tax=Orchesella cincta TaxID=48709 RepID=A0A1D2NJ47_ORCCI|nr:Tensin-4 [Orchesella cincta]